MDNKRQNTQSTLAVVRFKSKTIHIDTCGKEVEYLEYIDDCESQIQNLA